MVTLIYPDLFNGHAKAFFTCKSLGADRENISKMLSIKKENVYLPVQKHTDKVMVLYSDMEPKIADAVVTQRKGVLIGVQVADCVPILLLDRKRFVIGAVHAGWRGTASRIIKNAVKLMIERFKSFPEDIIIALDRASAKCYDVGREVRMPFTVLWEKGIICLWTEILRRSSCQMCFGAVNGYPEENIWTSNICSYRNPQFHSYRYHRKYSGRQGGLSGYFKCMIQKNIY
jgi:YfiH family protein